MTPELNQALANLCNSAANILQAFLPLANAMVEEEMKDLQPVPRREAEMEHIEGSTYRSGASRARPRPKR